jgi:hypothetical protein
MSSHATYSTVDVPKGSTTREGRAGTLKDPTIEVRDHFSGGMGPVDHKYLTSVDAAALVSGQEVFSPRASVSVNTRCGRNIFALVAREVKGERAAHWQDEKANHVVVTYLSQAR